MSREPRLVEVRQERPQAERRGRPRAAAAVPRGRRVRGEPGLEPGRREDGAAGADADRCSGRAIGWPRWSATWPRRTTRPAWRGAARRSGRSSPAPSATSRPPWSQRTLEGWELDDARLPVRRERRQPGLPRVLRPGRGPALRGSSRSPRARTSRSSIPPSSTAPTWRW